MHANLSVFICDGMFAAEPDTRMWVTVMRCFRIPLIAIAVAMPAIAYSNDETVTSLELTQAEVAQIDGRDWERTTVGGMTVDAVHRSVLLRFPGSAEQIRTRLAQGFAIERAEIVLRYVRHETRPAGYTLRDQMGMRLWTGDPPRWQVEAQALRQPWVAHGTFGPTSRYSVRLLLPWLSVGARNEQHDRWPGVFGPVELSVSQPVARLDVTALVLGRQIGATAGEALARFEESGVILRKHETFDMRYRPAGDIYEWAIPTGGHGLVFEQPMLVITLRRTSQPQPVAVVQPQNILAFAERSPREAFVRIPETYPSTELQTMARRLYASPPDWMSPQQVRHLNDLFRAGGDSLTPWLFDLQYGDVRRYRAFLRETLATPPRYWKGWGVAEELIAALQLRDFMPDHVMEHMAGYWRSYLLPDIPTSDLQTPHDRIVADHWRRTQDWRGRVSFFRSYSRIGSTQNFNFTAVMGALLGGKLIDARAAISDGQHGLSNLLLRYWTVRDGSTQELLDPYYLSITLSAVKMLADFAPDPHDRLIARIILERTMEMLATAYHPQLRRMVSAAGRARISGFLTEQDGIYGALHVLSEKGALLNPNHPGTARIDGMPVWGYDFPPGRVALQSLSGRWAPGWFRKIIDDKPFPFNEESTESVRGHFNPPLRRRMHLSEHFGLASQDIKGGMADILAFWSRTGERAEGSADIGFLSVRACLNICDLVTSSGGTPIRAGSLFTIQERHRAIVYAKPPSSASSLPRELGGDGPITQAGSVVGLWMPDRRRPWRLYIDGELRPQTALPITLEPGQVVTIEDGPTFIAIRPIPASQLSDRLRPRIVLALGGFGGTPETSRSRIEPTLTLANMHIVAEPGISRATYDEERLARSAFGGFVIEMADRGRFPDIVAFNRHMQGSSLVTNRIGRTQVDIEVRGSDGVQSARFDSDVDEAYVHFPISPGQQRRAVSARAWNGIDTLLPPGIERDTSWSQQGSTGLLTKNGVTLHSDRGRMTYLIAEPTGSGVLAYNLTPDPTGFRLRLKDGREILAEGRVGLLRIAVDHVNRTIEIDHPAAPGNTAAARPDRFVLSGFSDEWRVSSGASAIERR